MDQPLDDAYLSWLYSQIGSVKLKNRARSYWRLARQLYTKEFVWFVPNDDNRVEDGRDLRAEFLEAAELEADANWMDLGCSFLEMMVGLSRRLSFEAEGEARDWFWHLMDNLQLRECNDRAAWLDEDVDEILSRVIYRNYQSNGVGGLFPLQTAHEDQTQIELWYQMAAYLLEHNS
jgi:hypothetical protein